ncbi:hypothetical protein GCM10018773_38120 [Streptomyces candidus]|nr:hypothetical protein GCM10018773_38120 [Streptomyces candidus]
MVGARDGRPESAGESLPPRSSDLTYLVQVSVTLTGRVLTPMISTRHRRVQATTTDPGGRGTPWTGRTQGPHPGDGVRALRA